MADVHKAIEQLIDQLTTLQKPDGSWRFCCEGSLGTNVYMLLLLKTLGINDPKLNQQLLAPILAAQQPTGVWRLFDDEGGNISLTLEAVTALLYAGLAPDDPRLVKARAYLQSQAITTLNPLTTAFLACYGHLSWQQLPHIPVQLLLLPHFAPINFYDLVGYARVHIAPTMITAAKNFNIKLPEYAKVQHWLAPLLQKVTFPSFANLPVTSPFLHVPALIQGERFIRERIEPDGTLYSYFTATFYMIIAWLALGYPPTDPVITKALHGLMAYLFPLNSGSPKSRQTFWGENSGSPKSRQTFWGENSGSPESRQTFWGELHMQDMTSTVWDTALSLYALSAAGVVPNTPVIQHGLSYLRQRQQSRYADWSWETPVLPGGWGFSDVSTLNPDVDDTSYSLRALYATDKGSVTLQRGINWILAMQNPDGGWPAFERNKAKPWVKKILGPEAANILIDPSCCDLTGRTLEFLGTKLGLQYDYPVVKKALTWLFKTQEADGSWFGKYGISFIYGTWATLTGCAAVGIPRDHPAVKRGLSWLMARQNSDGGWGESCYSDQRGKYVPLKASTAAQTSWALDALITYEATPTAAIERGVSCLLSLLHRNDWTTSYPTGAGYAGNYYIHYHSYRYVWPLLALAHYERKFTPLL